MAKPSPVLQFFKDNSLAAAMFGIFIATAIGLSFVGWQYENEELATHGRAAQSYGEYLVSGEFAEAIFENWESEFLQMWALVILTIFLKQRGSADSKKLRGGNPVDTRPRYRILQAKNWRQRWQAIGHALYAHSLGLALLALFIFSFAMHAIGGTMAYNDEALQHGQETLTVWGYIASSQFWFESLQNWQSEFLAVGSLLTLSIFLRERGSPESKPIGEPNKATGGE